MNVSHGDKVKSAASFASQSPGKAINQHKCDKTELPQKMPAIRITEERVVYKSNCGSEVIVIGSK